MIDKRERVWELIRICQREGISLIVGFTIDNAADYPFTSNNPPEATGVGECWFRTGPPEGQQAWISVPNDADGSRTEVRTADGIGMRVTGLPMDFALGNEGES